MTVFDAIASRRMADFSDIQVAEAAAFEKRQQDAAIAFHRRMEREQANRDLLRDRLYAGIHWVTNKGERMNIDDMTPNHAKNSAALLRRNAASIASALEVDVLSVLACPTLRALEARAADRATWSEKRRDLKSRRKWEKVGAKTGPQKFPGTDAESRASHFAERNVPWESDIFG